MDIELLSLDRLPLPSLEVYSTLSFLAASCSLYYFWTESHIIGLNMLQERSGDVVRQDVFMESDSANMDDLNENHFNNALTANATTLDHKYMTWHTVHWASQQPHCVWPLVNLAYCLLILLSHYVQKSVFGNLRASEQENVKDQFWNLVFYKVVFVFGVVNVQEVEDAIGWCFFVSVIGFLQLARQLCKERHSYLILMNDWTCHGESRRRRILGLLSFIFFTSVSLFVGVGAWYLSSTLKGDPLQEIARSFASEPANNSSPSSKSEAYDFNLGLHSAIFMLCEIGLLIIQTLHALTICIFDQVFARYNGDPKINEDTYSGIAHSINYKFDVIALLFDLVHHVHMLVCCNLFLSMTSLIVSLQMRTRVRQIHGILKKRQSYIWLSEHIDQYPEAILEANEGESDNCAICWDLLTSQKAKSLPCNHLFHATCLRKWLLVSMNCPTCRLSLVNESEIRPTERRPRQYYNPRPIGVWGFLQTGQTLLDLFGGWDPQSDESYTEVPSPPRAVPLLADFGLQDWTVQQQPALIVREPTTPGTQK